MSSLLGDFYPGSKTPRRPSEVVDSPVESWDAHPITRTVQGKPMEFFSIGAFAAALNRPVVTVRLWERQGRIPMAPYRMPDHKGGKGDRLYTRAVIETTRMVFAEFGVLDPPRSIRWMSTHEDLTPTLVARWEQAVMEEKYSHQRIGN